MGYRTSQLTAAGALAGAELVTISKLSATVTLTAATISATASDNSYNDSGNGFVTAGFTVGKAVKVAGFTGNVANNITSGVVTAVTAGKLTIGGTDGNVIVDDAAGESVTITQWDSVRTTVQTIADMAGGVSDAADVTYTPVDTADWNTSADPGDVDQALDQLASRVKDIEGLGLAADAMIFKGVIDCSANPNYPAAHAGETYRVSVAGKIGGASGVNVEVGDLLLCLVDGTASGNHATVGTAWNISQTNLDGAVIGPASVTANYVALFDGTTGKLIKESSVSAVLDLLGSAAQGDIIYRGASGWALLAAGVAGKVLQTNGAAANPSWETASGGSGSAGKHAIPIMAAAMQPSVTGGCQPLAKLASAANQPDIVTLDFDATGQEYAQFALPMPKSWNESTITFKAIWSHAATTTNFGVAWALQAVAVSNDDTIAVAYGTAATVTDTGGTTNDLYQTDESAAITVAGTPAAEDVVYFRVYREVANGSDNMAIDARLHGLVVYITTDASTDA